MFDASFRFLLFDHFRVPYQVPGRENPGDQTVAWLRPAGAGASDPTLYWVRSGPGERPGATPTTGFEIGGARAYGRLAAEGALLSWLRSDGGRWRRAEPITDRSGNVISCVWRDDGGRILLPFDPDEAISNYWTERYLATGRRALLGSGRRLAVRSYYRIRPALPRAVQIRLRQGLRRAQARSPFPHWPVETALHDLYQVLLRWVREVAGAAVPMLAPWPAHYSWALVLTHDVETAAGYGRIDAIRSVEAALGYRSSWNLVPGRYAVDDGVVNGLLGEGCEVGVHGLHHDGRDLESLRMLRRRLPEMRHWQERWGAAGFRSPATQRSWDWMPLLGFDYDSSYFDTDPFEPQPGGCLSWLPLLNGDMVELPITAPQDHTLFAILEEKDGRIWREKAEYLRGTGGMVLLLTHPDYSDQPVAVAAYRDVLAAYRDDDTAWKALPREVAAWWRRRAASRPECVGGRWRVAGPAAGEAAVSLLR